MLLNKNYFSFKNLQIMGICNITMDSFSDGGRSFRTQDAIKNIEEIQKVKNEAKEKIHELETVN